MSDLPIRLRSLRIQKGMTQTELAARLEVSQNAIFNWESGKREPSADNIEKLAKALEVSPAYLMGWNYQGNFYTSDGRVLDFYAPGNLENGPKTVAAHFDGNEYTEDELKEICQFAEFVKSKRITRNTPVGSNQDTKQ